MSSPVASSAALRILDSAGNFVEAPVEPAVPDDSDGGSSDASSVLSDLPGSSLGSEGSDGEERRLLSDDAIVPSRGLDPWGRAMRSRVVGLAEQLLSPADDGYGGFKKVNDGAESTKV